MIRDDKVNFSKKRIKSKPKEIESVAKTRSRCDILETDKRNISVKGVYNVKIEGLSTP